MTLSIFIVINIYREKNEQLISIKGMAPDVNIPDELIEIST